MVDSRFFESSGPLPLEKILKATDASLLEPEDVSGLMFNDVAPLDRAGESDVSFFDNAKYMDQFLNTHAGACFVRPKYIERAPAGVTLLLSDDPYRSYALAAQLFYPNSVARLQVEGNASIHPSAVLGNNVRLAPGVVIDAHVEIGDDVSIGANTVIYQGVKIASQVSIGALCSLSHCHIGARSIIHRGVHIGQDGFGFALGRESHVKVPQLGRVLIDEDVEIGAGTTIDRGTGPDTIIGAGTKIDNLVQIGHNVQIGKRAVIIAQTGISGSTRIGDGAVLGGQVGVAGHIKIGAGSKVAAKSGVIHDIPAGTSQGGYPAVPVVDWHRQTVALSKLIKHKRGSHE